MMWRVLKLVYIDGEIYWLSIRMYLGRIYAFKKKENQFLNHAPHLQPFLTRHTFKRLSRQLFSSMLVQVCRLHKHLTIPTNGSSLTVHSELIFERNVGLLHKMFQGGDGGGGGGRGRKRERTGSAKQKWFVTLKSSLQFMRKEDFRLSLKHQLYNLYIRGYNCCQTEVVSRYLVV